MVMPQGAMRLAFSGLNSRSQLSIAASGARCFTRSAIMPMPVVPQR